MKSYTRFSCTLFFRKLRIGIPLFILLNGLVLQETKAHGLDQSVIPADVLCVLDGDTVKVKAHVWIGQTIETHVRLHDIDTPELKSKDADERKAAIKAKEKVLTLLGIEKEKNICDNTTKARVYLNDIQKDKYGGRVVATIKTENGTDIASILLQENLAYAYRGKTKQPFRK